MRFLVIEGDHFERQFLSETLTDALPEVDIVQLKNAGEFLLLTQDRLPQIDVLITEHFLALMEVTEDHEERYAKLKANFPEVVIGWDHHEAAERIIRYMRKMGLNIPVIIYTHSERDYIDKDVLLDPRVQYCSKDLEADTLLHCIRESLSVKS